VNRTAIDDLLSTILSVWYQTAAHWSPPGEVSANSCETCPISLLAEVVEIAPWPHDLAHDLATSLDESVAQISDSWDEEQHHGLIIEEFGMQRARAVVGSVISDHRHDLLDVLAECVEPRLEEYLEREARRGIDEFANWSNDYPAR
jgi:hypothetical protein